MSLNALLISLTHTILFKVVLVKEGIMIEDKDKILNKDTLKYH